MIVATARGDSFAEIDGLLPEPVSGMGCLDGFRAEFELPGLGLSVRCAQKRGVTVKSGLMCVGSAWNGEGALR